MAGAAPISGAPMQNETATAVSFRFGPSWVVRANYAGWRWQVDGGLIRSAEMLLRRAGACPDFTVPIS